MKLSFPFVIFYLIIEIEFNECDCYKRRKRHFVTAKTFEIENKIKKIIARLSFFCSDTVSNKESGNKKNVR